MQDEDDNNVNIDDEQHAHNKFIHNTLSSSRSNMATNIEAHEFIKTHQVTRSPHKIKHRHIRQQQWDNNQQEYNPGVRLYLKGLKKKEERMREHELMKHKQE